MKITKVESQTERLVLTGMVVDSIVCGRIAAKWTGNLFRSKWANLVAQWCVEYHNKYGKAPNKHIESVFRHWSQRAKDKDSVKIVEKFLSGLSDDYADLKRESNSDYVLDRAGEHFSRVKVERLRDDIEMDLENGQINKAIEHIQTFDQVKMGGGEWVDIFHAKEEWKEAYAEDSKSIVQYPGLLGKFFGNQLGRDSFVAFTGPEKRGKCLPANSEVLLSDGRILTIEQIVKEKIKTPVLALNEKTQRIEPVVVSDYWNNGVKECWQISTRTGRKVSTTKNHKYLTPSGWKYLKNLKIGDFIAVPKRLSVFGNKSIDPNEIQFLAFLLADGSCSHGQLSFVKQDAELVRLFESCCTGLGLTYQRRERDLVIGVHQTKEIQRKYPEALYFTTSKTKRIPSSIFQCPKEQIALFLRTFISCDGSINKEGSVIELTLANEEMCRQISHLLLRFGIIHTFNYVQKTNQEKDKRFDAWKILIRSQEYVNLYLKEIGFLSYKHREPKFGISQKSFVDKFPVAVAERFYNKAYSEIKEKTGCVTSFRSASSIREQLVKNLPIMRQSFACVEGTDAYDLYMNSDILWDQVTDIQNVGKQHTYDITVPIHHNFVANDFIVHNSFWLMDIAFRAAMQRRRVAFFEAGDMSRRQILRRFGSRITRRPRYPCTIQYPVGIRISKKKGAVVDFQEKKYNDKLDWKKVYRDCGKTRKSKIKSDEDYLRLSCWNNDSLHVKQIETQLREWEREEWVPDVVVIDYADILNMDYPKLEGRDRINKTWMQMRRLSQMYHCLVVTATQSNAGSYDAKTIGKSHFSEDKRKHAHVTCMYGINQTMEEKKLGVTRLNCIELRDGEYLESKCVHVAGCLAIGNMAVRSCM